MRTRTEVTRSAPLRRLSSLWTNLVTLGGRVQPDDPEFRRIYLLNVLLLFSFCVCLFFVIFHLASGLWYDVAILDAVCAVLSIALAAYLRRTGRVGLTATLVNLMAFTGLLVFLALRQDQQLAILWGPVYLPFAFFLEGTRRGARFGAAFIGLVIAIVAHHVLVADPLPTEAAVRSLINLGISMLALYGVLYYYEATRQEAAGRLLAAQDRLTRLSNTDQLTGLYNRRHFEHLFPIELHRARRDGRRFGLMILDVDHFKSYNDQYGHPAGDQVLRKIAQSLRDNARRAGDFAFRIGGEEFAVVYSFDEPKRALDLPESIRRSVAALGLVNAGTPEALVTVSAGLRVVGPEELAEGFDEEALIADADRALYQAKRAGRNQVVVYSPEEDAGARWGT